MTHCSRHTNSFYGKNKYMIKTMQKIHITYHVVHLVPSKSPLYIEKARWFSPGVREPWNFKRLRWCHGWQSCIWHGIERPVWYLDHIHSWWHHSGPLGQKLMPADDWQGHMKNCRCLENIMIIESWINNIKKENNHQIYLRHLMIFIILILCNEYPSVRFALFSDY